MTVGYAQSIGGIASLDEVGEIVGIGIGGNRTVQAAPLHRPLMAHPPGQIADLPVGIRGSNIHKGRKEIVAPLAKRVQLSRGGVEEEQAPTERAVVVRGGEFRTLPEPRLCASRARDQQCRGGHRGRASGRPHGGHRRK